MSEQLQEIKTELGRITGELHEYKEHINGLIATIGDLNRTEVKLIAKYDNLQNEHTELLKRHNTLEHIVYGTVIGLTLTISCGICWFIWG